MAANKNSDAMLTVALVGNPNSGKTTLFNVLTGGKQRVGNWAGVTVERKSGYYKFADQKIEIIDLPGTYSLTQVSCDTAKDECITCEYLRQQTAELIINVVDAANLERNLYITMQCLEQGLPVIVALNRIDVAEKQGIDISPERLSQQLGCPVVPIAARDQIGIMAIKQAVFDSQKTQLVAKERPNIALPNVLHEQIIRLRQVLAKLLGGDTKLPADYQICRWLEGEIVDHKYPPILPSEIAKSQQIICAQAGLEADILVAQARYKFIEQVVSFAYKKSWHQTILDTNTWSHGITKVLDKWFCNKWLGLPLFFAVMYALFFFAINVGGVFQEFFELGSQAIFMDLVGASLQHVNAPAWLVTLMVEGIGKGISTVLTFVPVIAAMFFALAFLEDCGYMARAAFVMDRVMQSIGLPGKSFVPMIVGFGCNVPAILGARTLDNKRDRIITVMMSPFMSCGARLAIFTVFVSAFFPAGGQNIVFLLYLIGIGMAILTGLLLKKTLLPGDLTPLVLEIPNYHLPHWPSMFRQVSHKVKRFVKNAAKFIIPVCIILGTLNNIYIKQPQEDGSQQTVMSYIGKQLTVVFSPMGISKDNWPAAVGLVTGIMAKEVVIGTLNTLYVSPKASFSQPDYSFLGAKQKFKDSVVSIFAKAANLKNAIIHPLADKANSASMDQGGYGEMVSRFDGKAGAFAYLLFVLLYFPCMSAIWAMLREVNNKWTLFSAVWTTGLAYGIAVIFYQLATLSLHPISSISWISFIILATASSVLVIHLYGKNLIQRRLPTPIVLAS